MVEPVNVAADPQLQSVINNNLNTTRLLEVAGWVSASVAAELGRLRADRASSAVPLQTAAQNAALVATHNLQALSSVGARLLSLAAEAAKLDRAGNTADSLSRKSKVTRRDQDARRDRERSASSDEDGTPTGPDTPIDPSVQDAIEMALHTVQAEVESAGWTGALAAYMFPGEPLASKLDRTAVPLTPCELLLMVCAFDGSLGATGYAMVMGYAADQLVMTCHALRIADAVINDIDEDIWQIQNHRVGDMRASVHCRIGEESFPGIRVAFRALVNEPQTCRIRPGVVTWF